MNPRLKKILQVLGFVLVVVLIGYGLFSLFFGGGPVISPEPEPDVTTDPSGALPGAGDGSPQVIPSTPGDDTGELPPSQVADGGAVFTTQLTSSGVEGANVMGNSINYYDPNDGRFYTIDADGNVIALSNTQFPEAEAVEIANDGTAAAIEFPDGSNILYDFAAEEQITLPNHWEEFEFSDDSSEVASKSIGLDPNNRLLVTTSTDGSRTEVIANLGENADNVTVNQSPNNTVVGFSETGSTQIGGFGRRQIFLIGQDGEEAGAITTEGGNFSAIWSPNGSHILYSIAESANDDRPSLWYVRGTGDVGGDRKRFTVETWVEKCTFKDADVIICAAARDPQRYAGYDHSLNGPPDDVYEINVNTGRATLIAQPVLDLSMFNLFVSSDENTLYFTDQFNRLNSLQLR